MPESKNYTNKDVLEFNNYLGVLISIYENSIKDLIDGYNLNQMSNDLSAKELDLNNNLEVEKYIETQYKLILFNLYSRQYSTILGLHFLMQQFYFNDYLSLPISATIRPILEDFPYISLTCSKINSTNTIEHKKILCRLYFNQYKNMLPDVNKFSKNLDIKLNNITSGIESKIYTDTEIAEILIDNQNKKIKIENVIEVLDKVFGEKIDDNTIVTELLNNKLYSDNYIINQINYQKISKVIHFGAVGDEMFPEHNDHLLSTIFFSTINSIKIMESLGILSELNLQKKYSNEYMPLLMKIYGLGSKIGILK